MKLKLFILSIGFSCLSFGQDNLQRDVTPKTFVSPVLDSSKTDLNNTHAKKKTKKEGKRVRNIKTRKEPIVNKVETIKDGDPNENSLGLILVGGIVIGGIVVLTYLRSTFRTNSKGRIDGSQDEGFVSDYLSRMLLSRSNYYRNVYLKSDAWQRKRYVVLKRDNWRCVYCGNKATQVHHKRYAKRNIGKEPIEWLVSVCRTCHEYKH